MQNSTMNSNHRTQERQKQQAKSWGSLSYYASSQRPASGMIDDPSKVASIDAASSCIACCCIFV